MPGIGTRFGTRRISIGPHRCRSTPTTEFSAPTRIMYRFLVPGWSAKPLVSAYDRIMGTHSLNNGRSEVVEPTRRHRIASAADTGSTTPDHHGSASYLQRRGRTPLAATECRRSPRQHRHKPEPQASDHHIRSSPDTRPAAQILGCGAARNT